MVVPQGGGTETGVDAGKLTGILAALLGSVVSIIPLFFYIFFGGLDTAYTWLTGDLLLLGLVVAVAVLIAVFAGFLGKNSAVWGTLAGIIAAVFVIGIGILYEVMAGTLSLSLPTDPTIQLMDTLFAGFLTAMYAGVIYMVGQMALD